MKIALSAVAILAVGFASTSASAALTHTFDLTGVSGTGGFLDEFPTLTHDFGMPGTVTRVDFTLALEAFDPSWQSEAVVFIDGASDGLGDFDAWISADYGAPDEPGFFSYMDAFAVDITSPAGFVALTAADAFEDPVSPNHTYLAGSSVTVTFSPIPEPATLGVAGAALAGVTRRRRRAV